MRILYHHRTASKDGQAVHIEEMIDALRCEGHVVQVVAPGALRTTDSAPVQKSHGQMGEDMGWVHRLKAHLPKAVYELMECAYSYVAYRKLVTTARAFKPDVIYERYNLFLLSGLMAKKRLGIPLLLEVNAPLVQERLHHSGGLTLRRLATWSEGVVWRGADRVLPVTHVMADFVRGRGVPEAHIQVIPNGINRAHFKQAPERDEAKAQRGLQDRLVLGFTGFVRDWHGVDRIVDWMATPQAPSCTHLLVVGDGPVRQALEAQAGRLGLTGRVEFTGVIHRDQVPAHVAAFDVALQPAVTPYASPLKLMEYLVLGKAIIAPGTPNLREILTHESNALLFDESTPGSLEQALTRLCSDADLRARLALAAVQTIDRLDLTWGGECAACGDFGGGTAMKILLFSSLYPSAVRPIHGIFVETRLRELLKTGQVHAKVVAPVPWFPSKSLRFGEYAQFAATPQFEHRNGLDVHHPRYLLLPKVGMNLAPYAMALGALATVRRLQQEGFDFDLIDAHYYYPDGVAAGLLAKWLGKPFFVTARGTDLNLIPEYKFPRKLILKTASAASGSIGVCKALIDSLERLGADPAKMHTLRNGVDLERFMPEPRELARQRLGLQTQGEYLLSVGHLIERKGHHIAIEALVALPGVTLLIAGSGPEERALKSLASRLNVSERVYWAGVVPQADLKWWYSAADALTLCSSREGWANVLLEAMACGTPVIATDIWGTSEVVSTEAAGRLMEHRDARALADAWYDLMSTVPARAATRQYAEGFSWDATTQGQKQLFAGVVHAGD